MQIASSLMMIGLAAALWFGLLEDRLIPKRFGVVEQGRVFRSGQLHRSLFESTLEKHGIERVVALRFFDESSADQVTEQEVVQRLGLESFVADLNGDGRGDPDIYLDALDYMVQASEGGRPVLVHCMSGTYRTGALVALYRVLISDWTPEAAVSEMRHYDWNPSSAEPLRYMNENMDTIANGLLARGLIDALPDPMPEFRNP